MASFASVVDLFFSNEIITSINKNETINDNVELLIRPENEKENLKINLNDVLRIHKNTGKVFFIAMIAVSISAIFMSVAHKSLLLFTIGIFAFFQDYFGFRSIKNKSMKPSTFDWIVFALAAVNSIVIIGTFQIVPMVFGG